MPKYEVIVKTDTGLPLFVLTQFASLTAGRFDRAIMPLEITMPQDDELYPVGTFKKDMILELWREQNQTMVLDGETCYFLRNVRYYRDGTKDMVYLKAYDANYILDGREVEYNAGTSQASKNGVACDVIKEIIDENFVNAKGFQPSICYVNYSGVGQPIEGSGDMDYFRCCLFWLITIDIQNIQRSTRERHYR